MPRKHLRLDAFAPSGYPWHNYLFYETNKYEFINFYCALHSEYKNTHISVSANINSTELSICNSQFPLHQLQVKNLLGTA